VIIEHLQDRALWKIAWRLTEVRTDGMTDGGAKPQLAASPIVSPAWRPPGVRAGKNGFFAEGSNQARSRRSLDL